MSNRVSQLSQTGLLQGILGALPEGANKEPGNGNFEVACLLTNGTSSFIDRLGRIQDELTPDKATELIDEWVELVSRFDECFQVPADLQAKRDAVVAKFRASPNNDTQAAILTLLRLLFGDQILTSLHDEQSETPFQTGADAFTQERNNILISQIGDTQETLVRCVAQKILPMWVGVYFDVLTTSSGLLLEYIRIVNNDLPDIF